MLLELNIVFMTLLVIIQILEGKLELKVTTSKKNYFVALHDKKSNWTTAKSRCEKLNGSLAKLPESLIETTSFTLSPHVYYWDYKKQKIGSEEQDEKLLETEEKNAYECGAIKQSEFNKNNYDYFFVNCSEKHGYICQFIQELFDEKKIINLKEATTVSSNQIQLTRRTNNKKRLKTERTRFRNIAQYKKNISKLGYSRTSRTNATIAQGRNKNNMSLPEVFTIILFITMFVLVLIYQESRRRKTYKNYHVLPARKYRLTAAI